MVDVSSLPPTTGGSTSTWAISRRDQFREARSHPHHGATGSYWCRALDSNQECPKADDLQSPGQPIAHARQGPGIAATLTGLSPIAAATQAHQMPTVRSRERRISGDVDRPPLARGR